MRLRGDWLLMKEMSRRGASPNEIVQDTNPVSPQESECTIIGRQCGEDSRLAVGHVGCCTAVGYDSVLESTRILDGDKASCWLPFNGCNPALEYVEQGPAG
jgi:hypothetical protein